MNKEKVNPRRSGKDMENIISGELIKSATGDGSETQSTKKDKKVSRDLKKQIENYSPSASGLKYGEDIGFFGRTSEEKTDEDQPTKTSLDKNANKKGTEGTMFTKDGKVIRNDLWLHPEVANEEQESEHLRKVSEFLRSKGMLGLRKSTIDIDLIKGRGPISKAKLVRKMVTVKMKNGKTFTRMQWVDPNVVSQVHDKHSWSPDVDDVQYHANHQMDPRIGNPGKNQKEFIDHHVKNVMSAKQKDKMLEDYDIKWNKHPDKSRDRILAIQALKEHLYKNPHLVNADHLPSTGSVDTVDSATGLDKIQKYFDGFKNGEENRKKLYEILGRIGIAKENPYENDENVKAGTANVKHARNMLKFKEYLKSNMHLMEDSEFQPVEVPHPNNKKTPTEQSPSKEKSSKSPSVAESGGNTISGVLKSMNSAELYKLMKDHGVVPSGADPRLNKDDKSAAIKHMNNVMKLKAIIEKNPSILNTTFSEKEQQRLDSMDDDQQTKEKVKDLVSRMSKDLKNKLISKYKDEPELKKRKRYPDNKDIDYMHGVTALKDFFSKNPDELSKYETDVENEELMSMKIGNKSMAKVLNRLGKFKGVGDVKIVEDGTEWSWKDEQGFVRRQLDEKGVPVLSVVDMGESDDDEWTEIDIPLRDVKKFLEDIKSGKSDVPEENAKSAVPLHERSMDDIYKVLTPTTFDSLWDKNLADRFSKHILPLWTQAGEPILTKTIAQATGVPLDLLQSILSKNGEDTKVIDRDGDGWKRTIYSDRVTTSKEKNANDYLIKRTDAPDDTWALLQSAKSWSPSEIEQSRKEMITSRTLMNHQIEDKEDELGRRSKVASDYIHTSLSHVPFDLLSKTLANGCNFNFTDHARINGKKVPVSGNCFAHYDGAVYLHPAMITSMGADAVHPMDFIPTSIGREHTTFAETLVHEFAHALDFYLSGSVPESISKASYGGYAPGNWNNSEGKKYTNGNPNGYINSFVSALKQSNPDGEVVSTGGNVHYLDNFLSWYEGRIYNSSNAVKDPKTGKFYDNSAFSKNPSDREKSQAGVEHWSESSSRYALAKMGYERHLQSNPDSKLSMDQWAEKMHNEYMGKAYTDTTTYDQQVSSPQNFFKACRDEPDVAFGHAWHLMNQRHPEMVNTLKAVYDRKDVT